ncbi:hypothetical protein C8J56DRAFT_1032724 [Mycena floridula]|nr:hypothetical protein C8J56DRAFT_1032724 [Mycena floridula]
MSRAIELHPSLSPTLRRLNVMRIHHNRRAPPPLLAAYSAAPESHWDVLSSDETAVTTAARSLARQTSSAPRSRHAGSAITRHSDGLDATVVDAIFDPDDQVPIIPSGIAATSRLPKWPLFVEFLVPDESMTNIMPHFSILHSLLLPDCRQRKLSIPNLVAQTLFRFSNMFRT